MRAAGLTPGVYSGVPTATYSREVSSQPVNISPRRRIQHSWKRIQRYGTPTLLNPLMTNGLSHPYHLDESISIFRGIRGNFSFLFHFSMKIMSANRIAPDGTPHFAASHLGLCFPCVP